MRKFKHSKNEKKIVDIHEIKTFIQECFVKLCKCTWKSGWNGKQMKKTELHK